jgi:hypothetical protein
MKARLLLLSSFIIPALAFAADESPFPLKRHALGSSLYLLGNFMYKEPVYDLHLHYDYRLTQKDALIIEGFT